MSQVVVVLVETSHPGNIGAAARAMKTMGLQHLRLVEPRHFPSVEATQRASGADDVLERAQCFDTLSQALADCDLVLGSSARARSLDWQAVTLERGIGQALTTPCTRLALVCGRERTGLRNEELQLCHAQVHIPTNTDYASLNLAAAVQVMAYELRRQLDAAQTDAAHTPEPRVERDRRLVQGELQSLIEHFNQAMVAVEFLDPENPRLLPQRMRRLLQRADLRQSEYQLLRGLCRSMERNARFAQQARDRVRPKSRSND